MGSATRARTFSLSSADIDFFSDWLGDVQVELGVERHNRTRVRVLMEEVLLRMRERFGEEVPVRASIDRHLGRPRLRVEVSNTSQLLLLAFTLGFALMGLGSRVDTIKQLVRESNTIGMQFAEWVSWFVPIFAGAFLCLEVWRDSTGVLSGIWKPLLVSLALSVVTICLLVVYTARRERVSPLLLLRKIWRPFHTALRSGSLEDSFGEASLSCTSLLGIDRAFTKVSLPQGLVLYMPISAIGTIAFTLFVARVEGVQGSSLWYVSAIVMAVVVFVATPPVPGANLLAYVVLFSILGISGNVLLEAMIFDIVFGIFAGAGNLAVLQLEMLRQAGRFGLLNREKLRSAL